MRSYFIWSLTAGLLCLALALPAATRPFETHGEPREALVAQQMLEQDNWILPRTYVQRVPSKPPFSHWLMASISLLRGHMDEAAVRFPSALCYGLFSGVFFLFVASRFGGRTAALTILILATSVDWYRSGLTARVDMPLAVAMGFALLALYAWQQRGSPGMPIWVIISLAAATLAKGPVALVLTGGIFAIFCFLQQVSFRSFLLASVRAFTPALVIASFWYGAAYSEGGNAFLSKVFMENAQRMVDVEKIMPHQHGAPYLLGVWILGFMPWTLLAAAYLPTAISAITKPRIAQVRPWCRQQPFECFCLVVVVVVFGFFCIPSSKRGVYLLPLYPFAAFLLARTVLSESRARVAARFGTILASMFLMISLTLFALLTLGVNSLTPYLSEKKAVLIEHIALVIEASFEPRTSVALVMSALLLLACALWSSRQSSRQILTSGLFGTGTYLTYLFLSSFAIPAWAESLTCKRFVEQVTYRVAADETVYSFKEDFHAASFYLKKPFSSVERSIPAHGHVFVFEHKLPSFEQMLKPGRLRVLDSSAGSVGKPGRRLLLCELSRHSPPG